MASVTSRMPVYVAFAGGILTPVLETIRRWEQIPDPHFFMAWFDDYIIGFFLVFGAWRAYRNHQNGYLIAGWGFATGMAFASFFGQIARLDQPDPAGISSAGVAGIKGAMLVVCVVCLLLSARQEKTVG